MKAPLLITPVVLSIFALNSFAAPPANPHRDISGTYKCSGYDPYAKTNYTETMVFKKTGDTYSVQLIHGDGIVPYNLGTALVNNEIKNAISYVYWDPKKPTVMGTGLFEIKADGSLEGNWTSSGTNQLGTESCTKA